MHLTDWENLWLAYRKAAKGKRGKPAVAAFEHRLEDNLHLLQEELIAQAYCPGPYHSFYIHEPKRRLISAAPFRDRVVHHALCNIIEPRFERSFIATSYANRVGKGTHRALDCCQAYARRFRYVLACDLRQFFPSINHTVLRRTLHRKVHELELRHLIDLILTSGANVHTRTPPYCGLPIGNLTSQFWANVYLNPFDHFIKRELRCTGYLRYVDDFLLFANDKATLWRWRTKLVERLHTLHLTIHERAQPRPIGEGIAFLGFVVYPHHRRLKRRKGIHFRRRLTQRIKDYHAGHCTRDAVDDTIRGWVNYVRYANTHGLRLALFNPLLTRLVRMTCR